MLISFQHWDLLVFPASIWQKIVAAYILLLQKWMWKGLHLQLEHLQHHQNHTLFVGTKNHFELHWYSPQIFYFMLCFPNFFWKLKKPSSEQTWFAGTKIVILSCLLQIPKFSFSSCFYKVFWNWWWPDWMRFECEIEIFATSSKPNLVCKNKNK